MSQKRTSDKNKLENSAKRAYVAPKLVEHGDIRKITQAAIGANTDTAMTGFVTATS